MRRHIIVGENGNVKLENLEIINETLFNEKINEKKDFNCGGIKNDGNLEVSNVVFSKNRYYNGGAIENNKFLKLKDVKFNNNYSIVFGGAIYNSGDLEFEGKNIFNRNGYKEQGIESELRTTYGGAIFTSESIYIDEGVEVIFKMNNSSRIGGAICTSNIHRKDKINKENTSDSLNKGKDIILIDIKGDVVFEGNSSQKGGAIASVTHELSDKIRGTEESTIKFNKNKAEVGGAIYNISLDILGESYLQFVENEALSGAGIFNQKDDINISSERGALFKNNKFLNINYDELFGEDIKNFNAVDITTTANTNNYLDKCTFINDGKNKSILLMGLDPEDINSIGEFKIKNSNIKDSKDFISIDQSLIDFLSYSINGRYLIKIDRSTFDNIKSLVSMSMPIFEDINAEDIIYTKLDSQVDMIDIDVERSSFTGESLELNSIQSHSYLPLYIKMYYKNNTFNITDTISFNNDIIKEDFDDVIVSINGNDIEFIHNTIVTSKLENYNNTIFENNLILSNEEKNIEFIKYLGKKVENQDLDIGKYYNNIEIDKNQDKKPNNEYRDVFNLYKDKNSKILEQDSSNQITVGSAGNESKLVHYKVINEDMYGSFEKINDIDSDAYGKLRSDKVTPGSVEMKKGDEYIVEFITNGGSEVKDQKVIKGDLVTEPKDPKKEGYKFKYWEINNEREFNFDTIINNNIKLYAKWEKIDDTDVGIIEGNPKDPEIQTEYIETVTYIYDKEEPIMTLYYEDIPGSSDYNKFIVKKGGKIKEPKKDGYNLLGWTKYKNDNEIFTTEDVQKIANRLSQDTNYYAIWEEVKLNKKEHRSYLNGYLDKTIKPEQKISREEVSAVFYRLLTEDYKQSIYSLENNFTDLSSKRWSNKHISTLANGGILNGYEDGEFKYESFITRAEVATIASRFENLDESNHNFTDVKGHWAEEYIASASKKGWIEGYKDGSFKPDEYITRAEFVTLVNRVLNRGVKKENILEGIKEFKDLKDNTWYYEEFVEAINGHTFNRDNENDRTSEKWLELKEFNIDM